MDHISRHIAISRVNRIHIPTFTINEMVLSFVNQIILTMIKKTNF